MQRENGKKEKRNKRKEQKEMIMDCDKLAWEVKISESSSNKPDSLYKWISKTPTPKWIIW